MMRSTHGWLCRRSARHGSVALALLIVMMLLVGLALQGLAGDATALHRQETQRATTVRLESAIEAVESAAQDIEFPVRLPISESPAQWIDITRLEDERSTEWRLRATEVRDSQEIATLSRTIPAP